MMFLTLFALSLLLLSVAMVGFVAVANANFSAIQAGENPRQLTLALCFAVAAQLAAIFAVALIVLRLFGYVS